jgi:lipoprotein-releasing system ATP-binding protein
MLKAKSIHKHYLSGTGKLEILKGIDLEVEKGKFVAIVGPSGAGKTTLLHILGGLDSPSEGRVILANQDIYRFSDTELSYIRNKKIGFVFQFYHLLSEFTVLENVMLPVMAGSNQKASNKTLEGRAAALLEKVGLSMRMKHFPNQLSGGERQRVAIARALINSPEIFFCDEPTGNLDSETGKYIVDLIRRANEENQMTVVLVTHNLELAKSSDRTYHLRDGVLVN